MNCGFGGLSDGDDKCEFSCNAKWRWHPCLTDGLWCVVLCCVLVVCHKERRTGERDERLRFFLWGIIISMVWHGTVSSHVHLTHPSPPSQLKVYTSAVDTNKKVVMEQCYALARSGFNWHLPRMLHRVDRNRPRPTSSRRRNRKWRCIRSTTPRTHFV